MDRQLLRDLLIVNREIFDAAIAEIQQQAHEDIDEALREASIWASKLEEQRSAMTVREVCEAAEKRARKSILQIREASRGRIHELKQELHRREQSIRAFCEEQSQSKHANLRTAPDLHEPSPSTDRE